MERQFALVRDGQLILENGKPVISKYGPTPPSEFGANAPDGCIWIPVEDRDAGPFNAATHWRLDPTISLFETERGGLIAVRLYPIVEKTWEHA